jgi:hypothetical protein
VFAQASLAFSLKALGNNSSLVASDLFVVEEFVPHWTIVSVYTVLKLCSCGYGDA